MAIAKIIWVDDEIESLQSQKLFLECYVHSTLIPQYHYLDIKNWMLCEHYFCILVGHVSYVCVPNLLYSFLIV